MISFTVPGKPQPWRRARKSGKRHFKDAKTVANQIAWSAACQEAMGRAKPFEGPLLVGVMAVFPIPARTSKAKRAAMHTGQILPIVRPDADNIAKNLDALNGVAFHDDAQIVRLSVSKHYGDTPGVFVTIHPLEAA